MLGLPLEGVLSRLRWRIGKDSKRSIWMESFWELNIVYLPMIESEVGSIVNLSSVAGIKGAASLSAYNATKGGVRLLTKGVALECANNRWPIRVNSVHPGIIETPIWDKMNPSIQGGANIIDREEMAELSVPTGQLGYPLDIANGVLFLASDESRYMTGTELIIDGGLCAYCPKEAKATGFGM